MCAPIGVPQHQEALQDLGSLLQRRDETRVPAPQASGQAESCPVLTILALVD